MGTIKNVEINYFNGVDYDIIRPEISLENVNDWTNSLYNKTEVNGLILQIQEDLNSFINQTGNLKVEIGTYIGQYNTNATSSWTTIQLSFQPKSVLISSVTFGFMMDNYNTAYTPSGVYGLITSSGLNVGGRGLVGQLFGNSFMVRNFEYSQSGRGYMTALSASNITYQYIAFG